MSHSQKLTIFGPKLPYRQFLSFLVTLDLFHHKVKKCNMESNDASYVIIRPKQIIAWVSVANLTKNGRFGTKKGQFLGKSGWRVYGL